MIFIWLFAFGFCFLH